MFYLTQAEGLITGTMVKMFTIAGPVIVSGTVASAVYGLVLVLLGYGGSLAFGGGQMAASDGFWNVRRKGSAGTVSTDPG